MVQVFSYKNIKINGEEEYTVNTEKVHIPEYHDLFLTLTRRNGWAG